MRDKCFFGDVLSICNKQPVTIWWNFIKQKPNVRNTLFNEFPEDLALGHDLRPSAYFNNTRGRLVTGHPFAIWKCKKLHVKSCEGEMDKLKYVQCVGSLSVHSEPCLRSVDLVTKELLNF